ncbi:polyphosphate--glucose phosphotransferase [Occultella gossypii]|uniref:ROK family protein n=1 Tax=Occultella gossypii TaxID=2800820 RepID=A0ABS7S501_9MICO|nr:ROK family protein [Occultella gossypii]MBZ2195367.1 ROK family protein [Occultella gossypii]
MAKNVSDLTLADVHESDVGFGIDIGGSGIKAAPVHLRTGELLGKRFRLDTPEESSPEAVGEVLGKVVAHFGDLPDSTPVGLTFPGVILNDVTMTSANMDKRWIGTDVGEVARRFTGHDAHVVNDADAAGYAEARYGAGLGQDGTVLVMTLGTGIGSALIHDGVLVPNLELGHLELDGYDAETRAASSVKEKEGLSYAKWAERLQRYFAHVEFLFSPDLFIVGGGVSKDHEKFLPLLELRAPIVPAKLRNTAGIVGAAALAARGR